MRRWFAAALLLLVALPLAAQRGGGRGFRGQSYFGPSKPAPYDSQFLLARLYYSRYPGWQYDWPEMESHFGRILNHLTALRADHERNNIFRMDDPELLKFPIAYLSEPGYWYPSDEEVAGLRTYLRKGGFLIVDDFHFPEEWAVFDIAIHKVLPGVRIERLDITHPIFNSFFPIKTLDVPYPGRLGEMGLMGEFYGIHDINDPANRLMVIVNYNIDIGDYIEWSPNGVYAVAPTNEAYKFAINYLIYGLTH